MSDFSIRRIDDATQNVAKFVFTKGDAVAEAVLYRYPTYRERTVICCSTQSGCPVGCRFCGAGDHFVRSLAWQEIVAQVDHCISETGLDPAEIGRLQIMFMSMGEPLLNPKGLLPALHALHGKYPCAALLISTSAPEIDYSWVRKVSAAIPTIGLQFSVHASTDEARNALIPFKRKLSLEQIALEGEHWHAVTRRRPFFNYCAHDGNAFEQDADRLSVLFDPAIFSATVSVVCERSDGLPATNDHQRALASGFAGKLVERGFDVRVFDPAGQDTIGGGCGQLHFVQQWFAQNPDKARPSIGAGLPEIHTPSSPPPPKREAADMSGDEKTFGALTCKGSWLLGTACGNCSRCESEKQALIFAEQWPVVREEARPAIVRLSKAARDVIAERERQISEEGWTPEHDDEHADGSIARAAACYALDGEDREIKGGYYSDGARHPDCVWIPVRPRLWPWHASWWKPKDRRHDLVRAGALILAEIERLDRASAREESRKD